MKVKMIKKRSLLLFIEIFFFLPFILHGQSDSSSTIWNLDRLENIGGCLTTILPNDTTGLASVLPGIINTEQGKAAHFNGINEGFLIQGSPLGKSDAWTLEAIIKPDSSFNPKNLEQRFLHIAPYPTSSERLLFEIRLLKNQKWAFDLFLSCGKRSLVLLDSIHLSTLHTANQWHHIAVVYEKSRATSYIDGVKELSDTVTFHPPFNAQTSIGARQNHRSWFKGTIRVIKSTTRALAPSEFLNVHTSTKNK